MLPPVNRREMTQTWVRSNGIICFPQQNEQNSDINNCSDYPIRFLETKLKQVRPNFQISKETLEIVKRTMDNVVIQILAQAVQQAVCNSNLEEITIVFVTNIIDAYVKILKSCLELPSVPADNQLEKFSTEQQIFSKSLEKLAKTLHPQVEVAHSAVSALNLAVQDLILRVVRSLTMVHRSGGDTNVCFDCDDKVKQLMTVLSDATRTKTSGSINTVQKLKAFLIQD